MASYLNPVGLKSECMSIVMNIFPQFLYFPHSRNYTGCCDVRTVDPEDTEVMPQYRTTVHRSAESIEVRTLPLPDDQTSEAEHTNSKD